MTTIATATCPRCDSVPYEAVFNSVNQVDVDNLIEGTLDEPHNYELIDIATDIVTAELWRRGAVHEPAFRRLWLVVRLVAMPEIVAGAVSGDRRMLCILQTMKTFDPTIAAPWGDLPPWPHSQLLSPLDDVSEERSELRRLFVEAVTRSAA